jgi:hypothetical protein
MVNRNSPTGSRTHQERRVSARRGNEKHLQWREFFPERVRSRSTGGLRPPLLAACADVIADTRFAPTGTLILPRLAYASRSWCTESVDRKITTFKMHKRTFPRAAGVSPPWCNVPTMCRENRRLSGDWRSEHQERRASARRGNETHLQWRSFSPTESVRAPRLAYASRSWCTESVDRKITTFKMHKRTFPRAAGVSPPWQWCRTVDGQRQFTDRQSHSSRAAGVSPPCERNASAVARVFPGASTFAHHGGLTPPALGCMCGCHCRYALRTNQYAALPTGGLCPPLLAA